MHLSLPKMSKSAWFVRLAQRLVGGDFGDFRSLCVRQLPI